MILTILGWICVGAFLIYLIALFCKADYDKAFADAEDKDRVPAAIFIGLENVGISIVMAGLVIAAAIFLTA